MSLSTSPSTHSLSEVHTLTSVFSLRIIRSYLIRPSPIHSRKLFMHRANSVRHSEAPKATPAAAAAASTSQQEQPKQPQPQQQQRVEPSTNGQTKRPSKGDNQATDEGAGRSSKRPSQTGGEQAAAMKSCLSDGDFAGILIKLNDEQDLNSSQAADAADRPTMMDNSQNFHNNNHHRHQQQQQQMRALSPGSGQQDMDGGCDFSGSGSATLRKNRRRSSCSDAEDSKRFDSMTFSPE